MKPEVIMFLMAFLSIVGLFVACYYIADSYRRKNLIKRRDETLMLTYKDSLMKMVEILYNEGVRDSLKECNDLINQIEQNYIKRFGTSYLYQKEGIDWIRREVNEFIELNKN